jgi:two-component sensor histidine kinase
VRQGHERGGGHESGGMKRRSLRASLMTAVVWALLPALALGLAHGIMKLSRDERDAQRQLQQSALATATEERNVIAGAEHLLRSLAVQREVERGGSECQRVLAEAIAQLPYYANVAKVDGGGAILCAANPSTAAWSVAQSPWWLDFVDSSVPSRFVLTERLYGTVSQKWVVIGALPLFNDDNQFDGAMTVAIDVAWLDYLVQSQRLPSDSVVALLDKTRRIIASTDDEVARAILTADTAGKTGDNLPTATGPRGETWIYAIAPLVREDIFVAFAMRKAELFGWRYVDFGIYLVLPLAMIGLSCLAIWGSSHSLVLRWVETLQRMAKIYAAGHYAARVDLRQAPEELQQLGESFFAMGTAIRERDRKLREALDYKAAAIREIHHRVKNNLQIVMSLLTLQASRLGTAAERGALEQARARVNALALVHNILHNVEAMELVDTQRLLPTLARQLHDGMTDDEGGTTLAVEVQPLQLPSEQATPVALFLVEALTNVYKHAFPATPDGSRPIRIEVTLAEVAPGEVLLAVEDNGVGGAPVGGERASEGGGTGSRLMAAFAQQLGGTIETANLLAGGTRVALRFPIVRRTQPAAETPGSAAN